MPDSTDHIRKFLIISLQSDLYALDLAQVAEVGDPPHIWPIPLAPPCYRGALNFHGNIVSVLDLSLLLGLGKCRTPGKIVVLHKDIASIGFFVDKVVKIVSEAEISSTKPSNSSLFDAVFCLPDGEATKLDLKALMLFTESSLLKMQ